jgi:CRP/FNR family transcriptional regulator
MTARAGVPDAVTDAFPALAGLPPALLARLSDESSLIEAPDGARLFDEHSPCRAFPLVLRGAVRVVKYAPNGRELLLYRVARGQSCVLTSSCLLGNTDYTAAGRAEGDLALMSPPQPLFDTLLAQHPPFRRFVFRLFSERVVELMLLVEEVAFARLDRRLAGLLLARGPEIQSTQQSLADELGSVREIMGRVLRGFAQQGLVSLQRGRILVLDRDGLSRVAEP